MPSSYLKKYNDDFNPVNERLELKKKLIIRVVILFVSALAFFILRLTNVHNVFSDISPILLGIVYGVMGLSSVISTVGIIFIILSLAAPTKASAFFDKISFSTKKFVFTTLDWLIYIPLCICIALYLYSFAFRIQMVAGPSMESSFSNGDRVISIYDNNIRRGDVVIANLDTIKNQYAQEDEYIIKRVIGVPGDKIIYTKEGLSINGDYIKEDYVSAVPSTSNTFNGQFIVYHEDPNNEGSRLSVSYTVIPEGYYFLMGDNRNNSKDSREFGLFSEEDIISVVVIKSSGLNAEFVERGVLE